MLGNLPFDVMSTELEDKKKHPNFFKAAKPIELIQEEGEIVFIPRLLSQMKCYFWQFDDISADIRHLFVVV